MYNHARIPFSFFSVLRFPFSLLMSHSLQHDCHRDSVTPHTDSEVFASSEQPQKARNPASFARLYHVGHYVSVSQATRFHPLLFVAVGLSCIGRRIRGIGCLTMVYAQTEGRREGIWLSFSMAVSNVHGHNLSVTTTRPWTWNAAHSSKLRSSTLFSWCSSRRLARWLIDFAPRENWINGIDNSWEHAHDELSMRSSALSQY